jgi:hypothetical protein
MTTKRLRVRGGNGLFHGFEPEVTLEEVGALLGISDHTAMLAEKSAERKIKAILAALKATSVREFVSLSDDLILETLKAFVTSDELYSPKFGWFAFTRACSLNKGTESLKAMAAAYAVLRVDHANRFRVPLLYRDKPKETFRSLGHVEAISMFGAQCLFRSNELRKSSREALSEQPEAVALVESEFDKDRLGDFEVPIITGVMVTLQPR